MKKFVIGLSVTVLALGAIVAPSTAAAQTLTADQILSALAANPALLTQLQALLGGSTVAAPASTTFTRDLTIGSTGEDVKALQQLLNSKGYVIATTGAGSIGNESTYFGALTQAALAKWQAANGITPAAGYFGPKTRAAVSAMAPSTGTGTGTGTGSTTLEGGAGTIDDTSLIASLNNEEVGEDEEDVEVAGIEIEADEDSDLQLTAVKLVFDEGTAASDFDNYATEVSIWLDGEEVARLDADEFNDDNAWTKTVTLDSGAIIKGGDTAQLIVAVSGINNLDTADAGDTWTVDFTTVRYVDGLGASTSETITENATTFSFNTFASAADVELKAALSNDSPDSMVVNIDDTDDTDNVELLVFTLEAEGSDIKVKDLPITFATSTGGTATTLAHVAGTVTIEIDGEEYSENASDAVVGSAGATVTFDDIDFTIDEGDKVTVTVKADINDTDANFVEGDQLTASFTASNRAMVDADDETGEELAIADKTGTATGDAMSFYDVGINATFVSADETLTVGADGTADDDTVNLTLVFRVEAFDGTVYLGNLAEATTVADGAVTATGIDVDTGGIVYRYEIDGTETVALLADVVTHVDVVGDVADDATDEYTLEEGEVAEITLTVTRSNAATHADSDGYHDIQLVALGWSTTADDDDMNAYEFDLEDFDTTPIFAN